MKKVFALLAIAGFVACNNAEGDAPAVDSAKIKDSIAKAEEAAKMAADTTKKDSATMIAADTTKKK